MKKAAIFILITFLFSCASTKKGSFISQDEDSGFLGTKTARSDDKLVKVIYDKCQKDQSCYVHIYFKEKLKLDITRELLKMNDRQFYVLPHISEVIKIEKNVYAIIGYNRILGSNFRNFWVIDFNKKKATIKNSVITSSNEYCQDMSVKTDTANNHIELYLQVSHIFKKVLAKDTILNSVSTSDSDKQDPVFVNKKYWLLLNGKETKWDEVKLESETGNHEYDITMFGMSSSLESCYYNAVRVHIYY